MKITKQKLKLMIESLLFEKKINYTPKSEWSKNKKNARKKALYGNPKVRVRLKKSLKEKWGKVPLCETCSAYDTSKEAKEAGAVEGTGYCHAFNFACSAKNSCTGWSPKGK